MTNFLNKIYNIFWHDFDPLNSTFRDISRFFVSFDPKHKIVKIQKWLKVFFATFFIESKIQKLLI